MLLIKTVSGNVDIVSTVVDNGENHSHYILGASKFSQSHFYTWSRVSVINGISDQILQQTQIDSLL